MVGTVPFSEIILLDALNQFQRIKSPVRIGYDTDHETPAIQFTTPVFRDRSFCRFVRVRARAWVKYSDQVAYEKYCKERIKLDASSRHDFFGAISGCTVEDQRTVVGAISRPAAGRQAYKMTGHDRTATQKPLAPI